MRIRKLTITVITALALVAASCGDDGGDAASEPTTTTSESATTTTTTTTTTATTTAAVDEPPSTTAAAAPTWVAHEAPSDCVCADGSPYWIHSRTADPTKVVLYFQGGGACFSEAMCDFEDGTYKVQTGDADNPGEDGDGIFDFDNPDNPFADWSFVFVPYCTGDVFLGDTTHEYSEDLTIEHRGFANASHGLDFLVENFGDVTEIVVTGSSAGGVPSPLFGGLAAERLPDANVSVLADASGGYASNPAQNTFIGTLWGATNNIPLWPVFDGVPAEDYGIPDLFRFIGVHNPDIRMARYDNAFDEVQEQFSALAGLEGGLLEVLDFNEQLVEDDGVNLDVYVAPGDSHTILGRPEVYTLEVEGVAFLDWLTTFVEGGQPGDVRCTVCEESGEADTEAG